MNTNQTIESNLKTTIMIKLIAPIIFALISLSAISQVTGGRENSQSTPKVAEATKLTGGSFVGDVNAMTGSFQASIPLGTVSTPAGLSFSLSLDHSSSFAFSTTQPMTAGIPYGDGWSPTLPTISIETEVFKKFNCIELSNAEMAGLEQLNYNDGGEYSGNDDGDLYWFAPTVSIPGVASGRAVFKYFDESDNKAMVFVLNKFEQHIELRYYGNKWTVKTADGTTYNFGTHLANYRAPSNQRVLRYDVFGNSYPNVQEGVVNNYIANQPMPLESVQNSVEPKQSFSVWYCDVIFNQNIPLQSIQFHYDKFGKFNYFQEFLQQAYGAVKTNVFLSSTIPSPTDYSAYTDIHISKVQSFVMESPYETLELDYATDQSLAGTGAVPSFSVTGVERLDSLYNKSVVQEWGTDQFDEWHRYKHAMHPTGSNQVTPNPSNPYLWGTEYNLASGTSSGSLPFDHGFLESERFQSGIYPGDVYELQTSISRPYSQDLDNGNGTVDVSIVSGTLGNKPGSETGQSQPTSSGFLGLTEYELSRGIEVFSTFNMAMKWQMSFGQAKLHTSNLFVMPNIPSTYDGLHIQVGPGNSDIDFASDPSNNADLIDNSSGSPVLNTINAYPFKSGNRQITSTGTIQHNFGTGEPWAMMLPVFCEMAITGVNTLTMPVPPIGELFDECWWSEIGTTRPNIPTRFNDQVTLDSVKLIRYSKNPYMLSGVRLFKTSGTYADSANTIIGQELLSQMKFEYDKVDNAMLRNYDYDTLDVLLAETNTDRLQRQILLVAVRDVPLTGNLTAANYGVADTSKVLTTFLGYTRILDNSGLGSVLYDDKKPYQGLSHYTLSSYTDHLGGMTKVQFYPLGGTVPSASRWKQNNVGYNRCAPNITTKPYKSGEFFSAHLSVHYLGKYDESEALVDPTPFATIDNHKVWEYVYSLDSVITSPQQLRPPTTYFKDNYSKRYENAFGHVKVYSPFHEDGSRTYIEYSYHGNKYDPNNPLTLPDPSSPLNNVSTLEEFLYYGKIRSQKTYGIDPNGVETLHDEKIIHYDHTLAFQNGYLRANPIKRETGYYDDLFARTYEYEDIYKNELFTIEDPITSNTYIGAAAYPFISAPALTGGFHPIEQHKFMEFYFFDEIVASNYDFLLNSYFVKKASEINRVYEKALVKPRITTATAGPDVVGFDPNPYGTGTTNPIIYHDKDDDWVLTSIDEDESTTSTGILLSRSALCDSILIRVIMSKQMRSEHKASVLAAQGGLSNNVWKKLIEYRGYFEESSLDLVLLSQPYLSDEIQLYLLKALSRRDNQHFAKNLLLRNPHLSGQVIEKLMDLEVTIPAEVFSDVLEQQPQLPEALLLEIAAHKKLTQANLVRTFQHQVIADDVYLELLDRADFQAEQITQLIEHTPSYPSDFVLDYMISKKPISESQVVRIFAHINRPISPDIHSVLLTYFSAEVVGQIASNQTGYSPLDQYCQNQVITTRNYIETRTDYEYFEADYTGKAIGKGFEMLLGHRSDFTDPSPYPYNVDLSEHINGATGTHTVNNLRLKHEPSWQVFSVKTSSPHQPDMYSREEYYYFYDLQNRYDRYWYNYDLTSNNFAVNIYDFFPSSSSPDTAAVNLNWDVYYSNVGYPRLPQFDGMERTRRNGNRVFAFQKSTISKNTRDADPLIRSEYYDYDARWIYDDIPEGILRVEYNGPTCTSTPIDTNCTDLVECTDCFLLTEKFIDSTEVFQYVPIGYCAWATWNGLFYEYHICPYGTPVNNYESTAVNVYCNVGMVDPNDSISAYLPNPVPPDPTKAMPIGNYLAKALLLRSVTIQVDTMDHSAAQQFGGFRMDTKNKHIAEFEMGDPSVQDANGFYAPYEMIYPHDHLTVRTILERNRYMQPELEENQVGLQTKYYYNKSQMYWNVNVNCTDPNTSYINGYNYLSVDNPDIGLPTRITVGYNLSDSMATQYEYTSFGAVAKVTEPNGRFTEYSFEPTYNRLDSIMENGTRLLSVMEYNTWEHDFSENFSERVENNYVATTLFNNDPSLDPNGINNERRKAFMDPLGRNYSVATGYSISANEHIEIHSGTVRYDNWGRVEKAYKNYRLELTTWTSGAPKILPDSNVVIPFAETVFENDAKGRALRTSNYDVDVLGVHAVKSNYALANDVYTACELGLNTNELQLIFDAGNTSNFLLHRTEVFDQDNKRSVEYTNAFGQKVATLKYNNGNQKIVTLFVYDSYGNLTKVINPEKQENTFEYNILGQLVKETSVDAGTKRYMYNKQGLVSVTLDEQGQFHDPALNGAQGSPTSQNLQPFYRAYEYDSYGRITKVGRTDYFPYNGFAQYSPLHYKTTYIGEDTVGAEIPLGYNWGSTGVYFDYVYSNASSQDWLASFKVWLPNPNGTSGVISYQAVEVNDLDSEFYPNLPEKEYTYGQNVNNINIGKLIKTVSYDNGTLPIQKTELAYDTYNNLSTQTVTFNPNSSVLLTGNHLVSKIHYSAYNYRNSLLEQRVDVNGDAEVDYHCFMEYDQLNRLKSISAATGFAASAGEATLLVTYEHDDANGLVSKKKHYIEDNGLTTLVQNIEYGYDSRDRLTNISSMTPMTPMTPMQDTIMDYDLYYDDQVPSYVNGLQTELVNYTTNWNGNINGTQMNYGFDTPFIVNDQYDLVNFESPLLYGYTYDKINRLTKADAVVGDFLEVGINALVSRQIGDVNLTYDRIGNIKTLHRTMRNDDLTSGAPYTALQHWNYGYQNGTNRLQYANGMSGTATRAYTYDANGNVLTDDSKELDATEYGRAAYPFRLKLGTDEEIYLYSADDQRIYKKSVRDTIVTEDYYLLDAMGKTIALLHTNGSSSNWEFYASGAERECRITPKDTSSTISVEEASFFLYDHLGNTRINYTPLKMNGIIGMRINSVVDYFPYGKVLREFYETADKERYLTTQHERDEHTGLDYRGARYYDSDIGRFLSLDPLATKFPAWSAYNYVFCNPISLVDPNGREPKVPTGPRDKYDRKLDRWKKKHEEKLVGLHPADILDLFQKEKGHKRWYKKHDNETTVSSNTAHTNKFFHPESRQVFKGGSSTGTGSTSETIDIGVSVARITVNYDMQAEPDRLVITNPANGDKLFDTEDLFEGTNPKVRSTIGSGNSVDIDLGAGTEIKVSINPGETPTVNTAYSYSIEVQGVKPPQQGKIILQEAKPKRKK